MISQAKIDKALEWSYTKAINGIGIGISSEKLAQEYLNKNGTLDNQIEKLIRSQKIKSCVSGFTTGIGGFVIMAVTLPANITNILYTQLQLISTIAIMGGHDPKSDEVRSKAYLCLLGVEGIQIAKEEGIEIGGKIVHQTIKNVSGKTLIDINKKVGFRLFTKFGSKGFINLGKAIPFVGGIIGGTIDTVSTANVGKVAKKMFI